MPFCYSCHFQDCLDIVEAEKGEDGRREERRKRKKRKEGRKEGREGRREGERKEEYRLKALREALYIYKTITIFKQSQIKTRSFMQF